MIDWLERVTAWMEKDIARMDAEQDADWHLTDPGRRGVPRRDVGWWGQKVAVFKAAYKGRFNV